MNWCKSDGILGLKADSHTNTCCFFFVFLLARNQLWQVIVTHDSVFVPECFVNVNAIWWSASLENKCFCCRTTLHLLCKAAVVCSLFSTTFSQREISTLYRCDWNLAQDKSLIKWVNILLDLLKTNSFFFLILSHLRRCVSIFNLNAETRG